MDLFIISQSRVKCNFHRRGSVPIPPPGWHRNSSKIPGSKNANQLRTGAEKETKTVISIKTTTTQRCNQCLGKSVEKRKWQIFKVTLQTLSPLYSPCIIIPLFYTPSNVKNHSSFVISVSLGDLSHWAFYNWSSPPNTEKCNSYTWGPKFPFHMSWATREIYFATANRLISLLFLRFPANKCFYTPLFQ